MRSRCCLKYERFMLIDIKIEQLVKIYEHKNHQYVCE